MKIIAHRVNTARQLLDTDETLGVEVDLRLHNSSLVCQHDPQRDGELFSDWLKSYKHKTIILNVKEEGIEGLVLDELQKKNISDFFFLDQSFPYLLKYARQGLSKAAVRVSEFESVETALSMAGLVEWVWVDIFGEFPLNKEEISRLKSAGFKLCLVSPELHNRNELSELLALQADIDALNFEPDAVCTKVPAHWNRK